MDDTAPRLTGFLRALCAISNGTYPEGGMSLTWHTSPLAAPLFPEKPLSNDATMERFFAVALGIDKGSVTDHIVQELRRVSREDVKSELAEAWVEDDPDECWSRLQVRWYGESTFSEVVLFWSLD